MDLVAGGRGGGTHGGTRRRRDQLAGPGWSQVWPRASRALKGAALQLSTVAGAGAQWTRERPKSAGEGRRGPPRPLTASNQRAVPTVLGPVPSSVLPSPSSRPAAPATDTNAGQRERESFHQRCVRPLPFCLCRLPPAVHRLREGEEGGWPSSRAVEHPGLEEGKGGEGKGREAAVNLPWLK